MVQYLIQFSELRTGSGVRPASLQSCHTTPIHVHDVYILEPCIDIYIYIYFIKHRTVYRDATTCRTLPAALLRT